MFPLNDRPSALPSPRQFEEKIPSIRLVLLTFDYSLRWIRHSILRFELCSDDFLPQILLNDTKVGKWVGTVT